MQTAKTVPITCCRQPVPALALKSLLSDVEQERFVKLVVELDAARRQQASCPQCEASLVDSWEGSASVSEVECKSCQVKVCKMCANRTHTVGQACPAVCDSPCLKT